MIEVQKQSFAAVEKSESKKIVVGEGGDWPQDDVEHAEAARAFSDCHLRTKGGIAVHVVDVVGEGGIGVVDDLDRAAHFVIQRRLIFDTMVEAEILVNQTIFEARAPAPDQAQLRVRIKAAMPHRTP